MTRSPQFRIPVTQKPDGTTIIVIEPIIAAPRGVNRNLHSPPDAGRDVVA